MLAGLPVTELAQRVVGILLPGLLASPSAPVFGLVVLLVAWQYRRLAAMEGALLGQVRRSPLRLTLSSVGYGLAGGLVGSLLIVLLGVPLRPGDLSVLWPVALLLALVHPRFLCFSYAAGLVGLASLAFGRPDVHVPGLVALVAILHVVEGVLVLLSGRDAAIPVTVRHRSGRVVGGYVLQRFWPVPVVALLWVALPESLRGPALAMPDWWPLIRPPGGDPVALSIVLWPAPVPAALGYADVALSEPPAARARRSGLILLGYSAVLLVLAWLASGREGWQWLAALASPGLHEWMILAGRRRELEGTPRYVDPPRGLRIMEVLPGGAADRLGLQEGDVLLAVNGRPVDTPAELQAALWEAGGRLEVEVQRHGRTLRARLEPFAYRPGALGVLLAPEPDAAPLVDLELPGPLVAWIRRRRAGRRGR